MSQVGYYGEMEMRRLAAPAWSVERCLLTGYWLVAGYGLRAWRAFVALTAVIVVAGWCFTNHAWARLTTTGTPTSVNLQPGAIISTAPPPQGLSLARAWLFAAQEAVALVRASRPVQGHPHRATTSWTSLSGSSDPCCWR
ncbi:hypothetical protein [Gordonia rhizosphera]|uniref:hypothetical protein n=1 Tax=Gordonia rhizosphera TaxID=83341 RepID=UPI000A2EFD1B|nr:hypothetical protein [Gordonia rhizosphera]